MQIIDIHNRLLPAMQEHHLDLEDFYPHIEVLGPEKFLKLALESRSDVLLIDVPSLEGTPIDDHFLSLMNTYPAVILFMPHPVQKSWKEWMDKLMLLSDKVISIQSLPMDASQWGLVKNQLLFFWRQKQERARYREQMVKFSQEMDELIRGAQNEMLKAKKIHEGVVPKRTEDLKGVNLTSKYAVGDGSGSEYFDVIRGQNQVYMIFLHTSSYLASSCLLGILNKYKGGDQGLDPQLFIQEASLEMKAINEHKKKPVDVQILLLKLDQITLQCEGFCFGGFELFSQEKGSRALPQLKAFSETKMNEAKFSFGLSRGEKIIVFSPGFIFNWNEACTGVDREQFVKTNGSMPGSELLIELFFQLKKHSSGDFLSKDATAVMMEVNRHGIQKV
ncbi:MAG: hypothetical protein K2P81_02065 [Bacteriovoracaceae bacterium]|nr:hypothetical protein [Bacteriovoracaceae bacterium]